MTTVATAVGREAPASRDEMHIAMAGPLWTEPLKSLLEGDCTGLPAGHEGSTPVWELVRDLVLRGQRVSAVTLDSAVMTPVSARGPLLEVVYGPYRVRHRMRDAMRAERHAVRDALLRVRPNLVHAHWCYEYALGALSTGVPTVVTVHDWAPAVVRLTGTEYLPYYAGRAVMYFITLARARYLTANSPYTAKKVRPFTRAAVEVIPNGFPDASFSESANGPSEPRQGDSPIVISINNGFGPLKNVARLLEAMRIVRRRNVGCELQLIGADYEAGGRCATWARQRGLTEGVLFVGPLARDEVLSRVRSATVLVHPAREESFGMTLVEAMAQGTPVIGGIRSGAVPWVLDGGKAGILVDVKDPGAIADAIVAVLTKPDLRYALAAAGHSRAWQGFRQSAITERYMDAYRHVLSENGGR